LKPILTPDLIRHLSLKYKYKEKPLISGLFGVPKTGLFSVRQSACGWARRLDHQGRAEVRELSFALVDQGMGVFSI
jgi:hypothetical protein